MSKHNTICIQGRLPDNDNNSKKKKKNIILMIYNINKMLLSPFGLFMNMNLSFLSGEVLIFFPGRLV